MSASSGACTSNLLLTLPASPRDPISFFPLPFFHSSRPSTLLSLRSAPSRLLAYHRPLAPFISSLGPISRKHLKVSPQTATLHCLRFPQHVQANSKKYPDLIYPGNVGWPIRSLPKTDIRKQTQNIQKPLGPIPRASRTLDLERRLVE